MWVRALRWAALLILAAMLGGHFTELFDRWDHTLRTGKDADYAIVLVAACAGLAVAAAKVLMALVALLFNFEVSTPAPAGFADDAFAPALCTGPSPPLLFCLRI